MPFLWTYISIELLGFFHEQSRYDRDSFLNIHMENVIESMQSNFDRHLSYDATIQETPYDYNR